MVVTYFVLSRNVKNPRFKIVDDRCSDELSVLVKTDKIKLNYKWKTENRARIECKWAKDKKIRHK